MPNLQKESFPKLCGSSSPQIQKESTELQPPPNLQRTVGRTDSTTKKTFGNTDGDQCQISKKNPSQKYVEAVLPKYKKNPQNCSPRRISNGRWDGQTQQPKKPSETFGTKNTIRFFNHTGESKSGGSGQEKRDGISTYATLHLLPASLCNLRDLPVI